MVKADISRLPGKSSKERAMYLLNETGEAFFHDDAGANLARFCYAKEDNVLDEACRRIERLGR